MSSRNAYPGLVGLLTTVAMLLSACGGASNVAEPTPLPELKAPAYRMEMLWRTDAGEGAGEFVSGFQPAVANDRVYVANRDGDVVALDFDSGEQLWRAHTAERLISGPSVANDLLLLGTRDGQLVALSADTGAREWTVELSSELIAPPAVGDNLAVARTLDGRLVAVELASGERRWTIEHSVPTLTMRGTSSPIINDGTVYAGLDNGKVVALKLASGEQYWEQTVALPSGRSELERIVDIDADLLLRSNELYAVSAGGKMASLSLTSGRVRWKQEIAAETGLAADDSTVYTADTDGVVWAVNQLTGEFNWQQDALKYRRLSAPVLYDGDLLVGDLEGYVHWLSADDGSVIARGQPLDESIRARPVIQGNRVVVLGAQGEVAVLRFAPIGRN